MKLNRVAVVGSGISGLICARALQQAESASSALTVELFDMSTRGPGGRAATRLQQGYQFDHGLSFVAPAQEELKDVVKAQLDLEAQGVLKPWKAPVTMFDARSGGFVEPAVEAHGEGFCGAFRGGLMCGSPSSNSIATHLASGSPNRFGTTVKHATWNASMQQWRLSGAVGVHKDAAAAKNGSSDELEDLGSYDALVLADSAVMRQGSAGFINFEADSQGFKAVQDKLQAVQHNPSFSLMVAFPRSLGLEFGACQLVGHEALMFLSRDSSKPGRQREDGHECWVAIADFEFAKKLLAAKPVAVDGKYNPQTKQYLDSLLPAVLEHFLGVLPSLGAVDVPEHSFAALQRWGAGFVHNPVGEPVVTSENERLVACGDFCLGSRFELAAESGLHAAQAIRSWM